jgi:putative transposase
VNQTLLASPAQKPGDASFADLERFGETSLPNGWTAPPDYATIFSMGRERESAGRLTLSPDVSLWIQPERETYFITICCRPRGQNQLCESRMADRVFDSARHRQDVGHWYVQTMLLMPDHLHAFLSFPNINRSCEQVVRSWKRLTARSRGIRLQRDFFEHRIRGDATDRDKGRYIAENPVRAGLVGRAEDWPYVRFGDRW